MLSTSDSGWFTKNHFERVRLMVADKSFVRRRVLSLLFIYSETSSFTNMQLYPFNTSFSSNDVEYTVGSMMIVGGSYGTIFLMLGINLTMSLRIRLLFTTNKLPIKYVNCLIYKILLVQLYSCQVLLPFNPYYPYIVIHVFLALCP